MEKKLNILCTICARGGSKGVPHKNIKKINRYPLIYYSITQAKKTRLFDKIVVSTDSKKISSISRKFGAHCWFLRPKKLSSDKSAKLPAIRHAFKISENYFKKKFDIIVDLDATSPLRNSSDIIKSVKIFNSGKFDNLVSISASKKNPYFNMIEKRKNYYTMVKTAKTKTVRRQDAPQVFDMNASIYIWSRKSILNAKKIINKNTGTYLMPEARSIDIDSEFDWKIVEYLLKRKNVIY